LIQCAPIISGEWIEPRLLDLITPVVKEHHVGDSLSAPGVCDVLNRSKRATSVPPPIEKGIRITLSSSRTVVASRFPEKAHN
jgi:hypothetical protein